MTLDRSVAPAINTTKKINFLLPEALKLRNGIPVYSVCGGSQDILKLDFIFDAGVIYQTSPLIANATNALIKEGTKNFNSKEIAEGIDKYGAFIQNSCTYDKAQVTVFTLSKYLENVLQYVQEILLQPSFDINEFDTYVKNAFEKFKINNEKVSTISKKAFMPSIFPSHPYGSIAKEEDYDNLSIDSIKSFYNNHYNFSNLYIIVAGNVLNEHINLLDKFFGNKTFDESTIKKEPSVNLNSPNKIFLPKKNAMQSAIKIGKQIPNRLHKDYFNLQILNTILGGYFGSRLMKNIREDKGYTYGIGSGMVSLKEGGYFIISTEVGTDVTNDALKEIYKEIDLLQNEKVSSAELDLVKNYLLGSFLKSCDGCFKMAALFENIHPYGLSFDFYEKYLQTIEQIDSSTILKTAQKYLAKDSLTEVVAGSES